MENGLPENGMEEEYCSGLMEVDIRGNGEITVRRVKGSWPIASMRVIRGIGLGIAVMGRDV